MKQAGVAMMVTAAGSSPCFRMLPTRCAFNVSGAASCLPELAVVWLATRGLFTAALIESAKEALLFQVKLLPLVQFPSGRNNSLASQAAVIHSIC